MVLKRLRSNKNPETVGKVFKESVRKLDKESISGHVVKKSAEKSSNALVKSAKFTILKLPHTLDYIFVTALFWGYLSLNSTNIIILILLNIIINKSIKK